MLMFMLTPQQRDSKAWEVKYGVSQSDRSELQTAITLTWNLLSVLTAVLAGR